LLCTATDALSSRSLSHLVLAQLRNGDTHTRLAAGFGSLIWPPLDGVVGAESYDHDEHEDADSEPDVGW